MNEDTFKAAAGLLIIMWAYALALLWFLVRKKSVQAGGELADIPGGLAAVIAALTAGAGWNRYISFQEGQPVVRQRDPATGGDGGQDQD